MSKPNGVVRFSGKIVAFTAEAIEALGKGSQHVAAATKDMSFSGRSGDGNQGSSMRRPGTGPGSRKLIRR